MSSNVFVIVPAHNEEQEMARVINSLKLSKRAGAISDFLIVANGCTDNTAGVAKALGARVVTLAEANKGHAFIEGVKFAHKERANVVVSVDADAASFNPSNIKALTAPVLKGQAKMAVSEFDLINRGVSYPAEFSGFRAISMETLKPIIMGNKGWIHALTSTPYSLERGLNTKIFGNYELNSLTIMGLKDNSHQKVNLLRKENRPFFGNDNLLGVMRKGEKERVVIVEAGFKVRRHIRNNELINDAIKTTAEYFVERAKRLRTAQARRMDLHTKLKAQRKR
ncbi:MAG: glycosyltransferase [archaeon]|jgi:glycosyltransferase involved in cell wall biosynthesis